MENSVNIVTTCSLVTRFIVCWVSLVKELIELHVCCRVVIPLDGATWRFVSNMKMAALPFSHQLEWTAPQSQCGWELLLNYMACCCRVPLCAWHRRKCPCSPFVTIELFAGYYRKSAGKVTIPKVVEMKGKNVICHFSKLQKRWRLKQCRRGKSVCLSRVWKFAIVFFISQRCLISRPGAFISGICMFTPWLQGLSPISPVPTVQKQANIGVGVNANGC